MATSSALDVGAVMKVLEAVASAAKQEVSHHLLRLLRKMGKVDTSRAARNPRGGRRRPPSQREPPPGRLAAR